jgi:hypothetical protein
MKIISTLFTMLITCGFMSAQGPIHSAKYKGIPAFSKFPICGSHDLLNEKPLQGVNEQLILDVKNLVSHKSSNKSTLYRIPVVFHIVHNETSENLPDSVIYNQLDILNQSFRRTNSDTINTRLDFLPHVGDTEIEFYFADIDPNGIATNGITRTYTDIEHFGGILPYGSGQNAQISQWVEDSLFYNFFRITDSSLGGSDVWDSNHYLNIWIGDLRILEPQFSNFEEIVYFALATPPVNHNNWPDSIIDLTEIYNQGVLMHYVNVGNNNPNLLPSPYNSFNGITTTGKLMAHEVGHYLGLRHIWGDGDCSYDDFIPDTPNSSGDGQWTCNFSSNTCVDTIDGQDLPDMIENYMDYSSGDCQNSFTLGQGNLMRNSIVNYFPNLADQIVSVSKTPQEEKVFVYPNPSSDIFILSQVASQIEVFDLLGREIFELRNASTINLGLYPEGVYIAKIKIDGKNYSQRLIKK